MRTSSLQLSAQDHKRTVTSFFWAVTLYVPLVLTLFISIPTHTYKPAGQHASVSLSFTQLSGHREMHTIETEKKSQHVETVQHKQTPAKVANKKKQSKPIKPQTTSASNTSTKQSVERNGKEPKKTTASPENQSLPSPLLPGATTISDQNGISTLIYGQANDPFLTSVKQAVEKSLVYPRRARRMGIEGTAIVEFIVSQAGGLDHLLMLNSTGNNALDEAALTAIKRAEKLWDAPGKKVRIRFPIQFAIART